MFDNVMWDITKWDIVEFGVIKRDVAMWDIASGIIIIIMVIFKCYFSGEHIALLTVILLCGTFLRGMLVIVVLLS